MRIKKGYVYSVEMLVAISIILVALIFTFQETPKEQEIEVGLLKRYSLEALDYLNYNRSLREFIAEDNETIIEDNLRAALPANFKYEIDVCSLQCDDSNVPKNKTVVVVDYYISGYRSDFLSKKIKMWVWT